MPYLCPDSSVVVTDLYKSQNIIHTASMGPSDDAKSFLNVLIKTHYFDAFDLLFIHLNSDKSKTKFEFENGHSEN